MTGISSAYEPPLNPDLEVVTDGQSIHDSVQSILKFLNLKI